MSVHNLVRVTILIMVILKFCEWHHACVRHAESYTPWDHWTVNLVVDPFCENTLSKIFWSVFLYYPCELFLCFVRVFLNSLRVIDEYFALRLLYVSISIQIPSKLIEFWEDVNKWPPKRLFTFLILPEQQQGQNTLIWVLILAFLENFVCIDDFF